MGSKRILTPVVMRALNEWTPGLVAGIFPMVLYVLATMLGPHAPLPDGHPHVPTNGFQAHMLIFTIANSAVSVMSSFFRIARLPVRSRGRAPLLLNYLSLTVLLVAAMIYGFVESGSDGLLLSVLSTFLIIGSVVPSFYIELSFARIHLTKTVKKPSSGGPRAAPNPAPL